MLVNPNELLREENTKYNKNECLKPCYFFLNKIVDRLCLLCFFIVFLQLRILAPPLE